MKILRGAPKGTSAKSCWACILQNKHMTSNRSDSLNLTILNNGHIIKATLIQQDLKIC